MVFVVILKGESDGRRRETRVNFESVHSESAFLSLVENVIGFQK